MKKYINLFLLSTIVLYLPGCSTHKDYYFHSALSSTDLDKNEDGYFVTESDQYKILFLITGLELTLKAIVENKTNKNLVVDWNKSTIQINDFQERLIGDIPGSHLLGKEQSLVAPLATDSFVLLQSGHFDMSTINRRKLSKERVVVIDQQTDLKSIRFEANTSPLLLKINLSLNNESSNTSLKTSFFIDRISNLDDKMFQIAKTYGFADTQGFYSIYTKNKKGGSNKIANAIFEQLITATFHSLLCGKLALSADDCYDD